MIYPWSFVLPLASRIAVITAVVLIAAVESLAQAPIIQPGAPGQPVRVAGGQGKVMLVDKELGFIVADFAYSQLPPAEQRYYAYRGNLQVGEVITTGQTDETFLVADINKGDIRAGDLIRPE